MDGSHAFSRRAADVFVALLLACGIPMARAQGPVVQSGYDRMVAAAASGDREARAMLKHLQSACPQMVEEFAPEPTAVAVMREKGLCMAKDPAEAFKHYRKAAMDGGPAEHERLGRAYATGLGVARDDAEAMAWFRKAIDARIEQAANAPLRAAGGEMGARKRAEAGDPFAMVTLAWMYLAGQGVPRDDKEAARWLRALESTDMVPFAALALMYEEGRGGFPVDKPKAIALYSQAAEKGVATAIDGLIQVLYAKASAQ
ncbi:MAG TPA: tetratricopeptide repeat protein [Usitatibacter sp.]|nr:tetratricopeptide repeat protein [Usitatibacter sp.]